MGTLKEGTPDYKENAIALKRLQVIESAMKIAKSGNIITPQFKVLDEFLSKEPSIDYCEPSYLQRKRRSSSVELGLGDSTSADAVATDLSLQTPSDALHYMKLGFTSMLLQTGVQSGAVCRRLNVGFAALARHIVDVGLTGQIHQLHIVRAWQEEMSSHKDWEAAAAALEALHDEKRKGELIYI